ncbi:Uncharacterised protein [uncultured archaeon]|nr:Uncharacterised protein [uncultured archaeon]
MIMAGHLVFRFSDRNGELGAGRVNRIAALLKKAGFGDCGAMGNALVVLQVNGAPMRAPLRIAGLVEFMVKKSVAYKPRGCARGHACEYDAVLTDY